MTVDEQEEFESRAEEIKKLKQEILNLERDIHILIWQPTPAEVGIVTRKYMKKAL